MKRAEGIVLQGYEDIFGSQNEKTDAVLLKLSEVHENKHHPYQVIHDAAMDELAESIRDKGVIVPGYARPDPAGGYEIIAGHRRAFASRLAEQTEMPFIVKPYSDEEANKIMVYTNLQRPKILPSEKAFAYDLIYSTQKQQGKKRTEELKIGDDNIRTIQRYIRLTRLIRPLLTFIDEGKMSLLAGVELSHLSEEHQMQVLEVIQEEKKMPNQEQAIKIREYSSVENFGKPVIQLCLKLGKKEPSRKVVMKQDKLKDYFPENYSVNQIEEIMYRLLDRWKQEQGF